MKRALLLLLLVACKTEHPKEDAAPPAPTATVASASPEDGKALVRGACLSCHGEELLEQQRLTPAQWQKVVTKMVGWGANLEASDTAALTTYLATTYGPDAGAWTPETVTAEQVAKYLAPLPDGPYANGSIERGEPLYTDKCSGCHGSDARGHIGTLLVERPFLWQAFDVAETIRHGRGKMAPLTLKDLEIADILAYLRSLKGL